MKKQMQSFFVAMAVVMGMGSVTALAEECHNTYSGTYTHDGSSCYTSIEDCTVDVAMSDGTFMRQHTTSSNTHCADGRNYSHVNVWAEPIAPTP